MAKFTLAYLCSITVACTASEYTLPYVAGQDDPIYIKEAENIIESGNFTQSELNAALTRAVNGSNFKMVKTLVEGGAKVKGSSIMFTVADRDPEYKDTLKIAKYLVKKGALVDPKRSDGTTPMFIAAPYHPDVALLLLENGADPQVMPEGGANIEKSTILIRALKKAHYNNDSRLEFVKKLVKKGVDVNAVDKEGCTPLLCAVLLCFPDIVQILVDAGADVNAHNPITVENTPLTYMLSGLWLSISFEGTDPVKTCEILLSAGADPYIRNKRGRNAFKSYHHIVKMMENNLDHGDKNLEKKWKRIKSGLGKIMQRAERGEFKKKAEHYKRMVEIKQKKAKAEEVSNHTITKKNTKQSKTAKEESSPTTISTGNNKEKVALSLAAIFVIAAGSGIFYFRKTSPK